MRRLVGLACVVLLLVVADGARAATGVGTGGGTPGTSARFTLVGHSALAARGMNAALALYGRYVYVGNRTDGSMPCSSTGGVQPCHASANVHRRPGILIVDAKKPARPRIVGEVGAPYAAQPGITTRELRVWPQKKLLMVMTFRCSSQLHDCPPGTDVTFPYDIKFFSLRDPRHPRFLSSYVPKSAAGKPIKPHEMFLWVDPKRAGRALLWISTPTLSTDPAMPNLTIVDISRVPAGGAVRQVAEGNWNDRFPSSNDPDNYDTDLDLHSMAPRADGRTTYLAYLRGGTLALDTSKIAANAVPAGMVESLNDDLLTPIAGRARWGAGAHCTGHTVFGCSESHTAAPVPGRSYIFNTDEVYGSYTDPSHGWPWGWARLINARHPDRLQIVGEYKITQNTPAYTPEPATNQRNSYASHNPTLLPKLGIVAWHSGGLQAVDITRASRPRQAGWFSPNPLASVATEDPALTSGANKVAVWSYPIIRRGLIYVTDIRNGLYILRYRGRYAGAVNDIRFLEGNSNLGDAVRLGRR